MEVFITSHTENIEETIAMAASTCYSKIGNTIRDRDKATQALIEKILDMGHYSVLEHGSITFAISDISRALSHQLVRHRIASFSQRSQRYVNENNFTYVIPESIQNDPILKSIYESHMSNAKTIYEVLTSNSIPEEDARYVLPNACTTSLVMTMNVRELHHFFNLRCCTRAQQEIRLLAEAMLKLCKQNWPVLFTSAGASCVKTGICPEGEKSCLR